MHWIRARDPAGRVLALPNQTPNLIAACGLTRAQADQAVWTIDRQGRRRAGAAAVNRVLRELGGGWAWLALAYRLPPLAWAQDCLYGWVAAHRGQLARWWSALPECDRPGVDCTDD